MPARFIKRSAYIALLRALAGLLAGLCTALLVAIAAAALGAEDLCFFLFGKRRPTENNPPRSHASASVVIPNWNGRDLLERFLPSVTAALAGNAANEVIVVDNASTDGSAQFVKEHFPTVRVLELEQNLGFGAGSNAGFQIARNDVVVLLNNDMRVEPHFLEPLLAPFADQLVFSVSCQIFFSDPERRRDETGLTECWFTRGRLHIGHRVDPEIQVPFPCAYPGGGSSAFDRKKFLEVGGFDELFHPFYYEDTDLGMRAWKRGWKVIYQPASIVYHEHRGTIGKTFSPAFIKSTIEKNAALYCWKNLHDWRMLFPHFVTGCFANARGMMSASLQLRGAMQSRWRARQLATIPDGEAFLRQRGGYFRDRFQASAEPMADRLNVLFLSPYPIEPPVHGGAVFMRQTLHELSARANIHLISFLDKAGQLRAQEPLSDICASAQFFLRRLIPPYNPSSLFPHAIREFADPDFAWAVHRTIYLSRIDVIQIDYTILGQYGGGYRNIPCILFEHDIFFQSLWRGMQAGKFTRVGVIEYMRMLRYELRLLPRFTRIQVCSHENRNYLLEFLPELEERIDTDLRAVIDTRAYTFVTEGREPDTVLFAGNFRHYPNADGLLWFVTHVWPLVLNARPETRLIVVGADPPESLTRLPPSANIVPSGFVDDIREPLSRYSVFVCPVLSGSGVRVKLLEAFASGIPAVSTGIGAEGLTSKPGELCELADEARPFAWSVLRLLTDRTYARTLALRARHMVEREKDASAATERLIQTYEAEVAAVRPPGDANRARAVPDMEVLSPDVS